MTIDENFLYIAAVYIIAVVVMVGVWGLSYLKLKKNNKEYKKLAGKDD
jgi:CHASE3 domain sensor protein